MSVFLGTTNTDSTGSSANLNAGNATGEVDKVYHEDGVDGVVTGTSKDTYDFDTVTVVSDEWNKDGYKEAKIDGSFEVITVEDFVDVDIQNAADSGFSHIHLLNTKRGQIDTTGSDSNDSIFIAVESNTNTWSNKFVVETGAGNDVIEMVDVLNSKHTEFDISLGDGNDTADVSQLQTALDGSKERIIDGGKGLDVLVTNGDTQLVFSGFEVIQGDNFGAGSQLTLDATALANNANPLGLVVSNLDLSFDEASIDGSIHHDLNAFQEYYVEQLGFDAENFAAVEVAVDGQKYVVLTDDADYLA
ncbi:hypothetical protein AB2S62_17130 [Vibrio sp. NTOU-M3]|uniref:hypothetical protein n=1 Tax=Vibrio sp. NTOU-M3 TaxID=3234954 RepID=UPI00349F35B1